MFFQGQYISILVKIWVLLALNVNGFFVSIIYLFFGGGIIVVNTFTQLSPFQVINSCDVSGRDSCVTLYTTLVINRENPNMSSTSGDEYHSPSQGNTKTLLLFWLSDIQTSSLISAEMNRLLVWLGSLSLPSVVNGQPIFQGDKVDNFSQPATWAITDGMCYRALSQNSSV